MFFYKNNLYKKHQAEVRPINKNSFRNKARKCFFYRSKKNNTTTLTSGYIYLCLSQQKKTRSHRVSVMRDTYNKIVFSMKKMLYIIYVQGNFAGKTSWLSKIARNRLLTVRNCKEELALPSNLPIMYLEIANKLTLIRNCEIYLLVF